MAVIPKWMCDRDNSMHDSKKDADAQDKMLELAEASSIPTESAVTIAAEVMLRRQSARAEWCPHEKVSTQQHWCSTAPGP